MSRRGIRRDLATAPASLEDDGCLGAAIAPRHPCSSTVQSSRSTSFVSFTSETPTSEMTAAIAM